MLVHQFNHSFAIPSQFVSSFVIMWFSLVLRRLLCSYDTVGSVDQIAPAFTSAVEVWCWLIKNHGCE